MTDYLEPSGAEHDDALAEQLRRLERALARLTAAGGEAEGAQTAEARPGRTGRLSRREDPGERVRIAEPGEQEWRESGQILAPDGRRRRSFGARPGRGRADTPEAEHPGDEGRSEREPLPLEAQLSRLDAAVRLTGGALWGAASQGGALRQPGRTPGGRAGFAPAMEQTVPGEGEEPGWGRAAAGGLPYGRGGPGAWEETRWAERADRVFRRDSRRYDGGFYLY